MSATRAGTTAERSAVPPGAVRAAVVILGLFVVSDVAWLVLGLVVAPGSGGEVAAGIVMTVVRVAISVLLARLLWRGSNTGRVVIVVLNLLAVAFYAVSVAVDGLGPVDGYLAWTAAELLLVLAQLGLMFTRDTRSWCHSSRPAQGGKRPAPPGDEDGGEVVAQHR